MALAISPREMDATRIPLPLSPLGRLNSVSLSPDGKYLALSNRTRGGIWDVATGHRIILLRSFDHSASATTTPSTPSFLSMENVVRGITPFLHSSAQARARQL